MFLAWKSTETQVRKAAALNKSWHQEKNMQNTCVLWLTIPTSTRLEAANFGGY
jgi:hypothetical protein